jgi:hypothetical protein
MIGKMRGKFGDRIRGRLMAIHSLERSSYCPLPKDLECQRSSRGKAGVIDGLEFLQVLRNVQGGWGDAAK